MSRKKFLSTKTTKAKIVAWDKIVPKTVFPLKKNSKAVVVVDHARKPQLFIFDTFSFLDVLSEIDEKLVDRLSPTDYHSKTANPAGWLIDEIEAKLPLQATYIKSLKDAISEAKKKGWIPLEQIKQELNLD